jgi:hypothetical protein
VSAALGLVLATTWAGVILLWRRRHSPQIQARGAYLTALEV